MRIREQEEGEQILFLHGGNVAGWMWDGQADALPGHRSVIPDLPGFGDSAAEPWSSMAEVADALAEQTVGPVHVVGLSLGGVLGTVFAARHPSRVASLFVTGAARDGVDPITRFSGLAQLGIWGSRSYWSGLARVFRLPDDSVERFVTTGLGIDRESARRMMRELYAGMPDAALAGLRSLTAPALVIAGEREARTVARARSRITDLVPHAIPALAPAMHHVWSAEDPELFHTVLAHWLAHQEAAPQLIVGP